MSILASSHAKGTVLRFLLLLATGAVNLQIASAGCDYLLTVCNRGGVDRFNDETQFLAAGGATTTCTVSSGSNYCDYAYLEIVYGDGVDGSNAYNGNTGSVGSITTGGTITSCDFSISMSDPNDATVLGLELFWRSRGNVQITCSCDRAIPPTDSPTRAPWRAPLPPPEDDGPSNCFSETATVQVESKGAVSMKNLQVGDKVLTGNKNTPYQPVYSFGHRHEHLEGTFFQIHTADKAPLEMTGSHLMFIVDDENKLQTVRADAVKVGDHVVKSRDDGVMLPSTVTEITTIRKKGMYMPLTPDGTIVVDGIVASTYVSIQDQAPAVVQNSKLFPALTEQRILHWFLSPYRMLCLGVSSNACQFLESRDEEGIHFWLVAGRKLAEFANGQGFLVQVLLIGIPVFLVFALLNLLEVLLGGPALAPFVCFAAIVFGGWIVNNLQRRRMRRENNETKKLE